ncbi:hypothetical protein QNI19_29660 [Cytophagaceae bacterium DM2B3-1]|uniref:Lipoprotein n=1 Tax=Xanthocytophaga flava TaxID=3048013 RepID=A0ABT7CTT5_9BACT|nr:hypothetical protein [Xanthocytophaga flavus]MDJ1471834.1 hypothetical protein [Xanthocytophaga flavus]MDJ1497142.1 hypothetical protein [Xanthocytophaga flavus]
MKPYYYLILCLLLGCNDEKKATSLQPPVTPKVDTSLSFKEMLHMPRHSSEGYGEYETFIHWKNKIYISDSLAFKDDCEIRLYLFASFGGIYCLRYTLYNNEWKGECINYHFSTNKLEKKPISPKEGWKPFIQNAISNGLLDIPTRAEMNEEITKLGKLYPDHNLVVMDGRRVVIEVISRDHYDLRLYNNQLSIADDYPEAVVLKKINKLVNSLFILDR